MAGPVIAIDRELLRTHASRVHTVQTAVAEAASAARSADLAGGAFGILCAFLVPPTTLVTGIAESMITAAATMLERTSNELRSIATDVDTREEDIASQLRALHDRIR